MKEIPLTQGKVALVDDEDFEYLNQWKWHAFNAKHTFYAMRCGKKAKFLIHRVILGLTDPGIQTDHIDRNGLNNQRLNLRSCTASQNLSNRTSHRDSISKYLGVCLDRECKKKKWKATITKNGIHLYLGHFESEVNAALAYNIAAKRVQGEFANLNKV